MSQPDILMGGLATVHFSKCGKLAIIVQRYGCIVKQGDPTYGVQVRNSCKHSVRDNIYQCKNHEAGWWTAKNKKAVASSEDHAGHRSEKCILVFYSYAGEARGSYDKPPRN